MKKVVFASMLKPVDDVRTYHKLAKSLLSSGKYEIFIIGFPSKQPVIDPDIKFLPLPSFKRLSPGRLLLYQKAGKMIANIQPDLVIVNTHELLPVAVRLKRQSGFKLIYDVRENYYDNLRLSGMPLFVADWIRAKENRLAKYIDHFTLAEKCYAEDLPFVQNSFTILENTSITKGTRRKKVRLKRLVFTGTLSDKTGVFRAIEIAKALHQADPDIRLHICGNSLDRAVIKSLQQQGADCPWINLELSPEPLPYSTILNAIRQADAGLILYADEEALNKKMPTKLYEYLAHRLPIILTDPSPWTSYTEQYHAAVSWKEDAENFLKLFGQLEFYQPQPGNEVMWHRQDVMWRDLVNKLLYN